MQCQMSITNEGNTDIISEAAAAFARNKLPIDVTNDVNQSASSSSISETSI